MVNANYSLGQHEMLVTQDMCRNCGMTGAQIASTLGGYSCAKSSVIGGTSLAQSQPTTQAPPQTVTVNTSNGSWWNSGIKPKHSDPTDPVPFDPTIGDTAETVWGELVEIIGKTVSFDPIQGCDATEYRVRRVKQGPGQDLDFYTQLLRKLKVEEPVKSASCECGAEKIGSVFHSKWCPLYREIA